MAPALVQRLQDMGRLQPLIQAKRIFARRGRKYVALAGSGREAGLGVDGSSTDAGMAKVAAYAAL
jgi:hypothetical protein